MGASIKPIGWRTESLPRLYDTERKCGSSLVDFVGAHRGSVLHAAPELHERSLFVAVHRLAVIAALRQG